MDKNNSNKGLQLGNGFLNLQVRETVKEVFINYKSRTL